MIIFLTFQDIVTEFMNKGNLLDLMKSNKEVVTTKDMMVMAAQVASGNADDTLNGLGMLYLSTENIVHRDLALRNIKER